MTRVLVTGGRNRRDADTIWTALNTYLPTGGGALTVVHGAADGADEAADQWVRRMHVEHPHLNVVSEPHPADWEAYGKAAGPRRNAEMIRLGADLVLAFPDPRPEPPKESGTWGCVELADRDRNPIPVRVYRLPSDPPRRVQRQRTKGWRKPAGTITADRGGSGDGRWSNPYRVGGFAISDWRWTGPRWEPAAGSGLVPVPDAETAVALFDGLAARSPEFVADARASLRGRDVACYCALDAKWCHVNTLLELANGGAL